MRYRRWGQILPGIAGSMFGAAEAGHQVTVTGGPMPEAATPGKPAYADAHEFDRRAIATFLTSPERPSKPADLAALYAIRNPILDVSVVTARTDLIKHWEHRADPVFTAQARTTAVPLAGRYVDARGYDCQVLVEIAKHLDDALDGTSLEAIADQVDHPARAEANAARHDALDQVLTALHARLTGPEISDALTTGHWPDLGTLDLMAALAA